LAVDPAYCTMRLKTAAAVERLKKDLNKAHPYLVWTRLSFAGVATDFF
jgi:hypothetical protein